MIRNHLLSLAIVAVAAPAFAAAEISKPDKAITCAACHGAVGVSATGIYPNIAGQHSNYLEQALKAYRSGSRKNVIMGAQAANLTDDEIKQLAHWFSNQESPLYTPSVHGELKP